jgi:hypothetical protein
LGRIATLLTLFNVLIGTLIVPRFSRLENKTSLLLSRFSQILFISTLLMVLFAVGIVFFADQILWILGKKYSMLNSELGLIMMSACLNVISGVAFGLYSSRGWVLPPTYTILKTVLVIVVASYMFNLSTLKGVLYLNILFSITAVFTDVFYGYYNILKHSIKIND